MNFAPCSEVINWYKYDIRDFSREQYDKWYSLMSEDKKQRVDKFCFDDDKKRTVAAEMLIRKAISNQCKTPPENINFCIGDHGKPFLKNIPIEFNISHSGNFVVCAVANSPVGIDIEEIRPVDLKVTKRICTEEELLYIFGKKPSKNDFKRTTDKEILTRFFKVWTTKEAYGKCIGKGIKSIKVDTKKISVQNFYFNNYVISIYID